MTPPRLSLRTTVLFGAPLLMTVSSLIHPHPPFSQPGMLDFLRPRLSLWMGVHVVQLFLVFLLGLVLWFLTEGIVSNAATISRLATALFLVFYASFDSVVGIGTGLLAQVMAADRALDSAVAADVMDRYWLARFDSPVGPLIGLADVTWLVAVTTAAGALHARGASWPVVALLIVAGIFFAIDHPSPTGTIGTLALFAANVLLRRDGLLTSRERSGGTRFEVPPSRSRRRGIAMFLDQRVNKLLRRSRKIWRHSSRREVYGVPSTIGRLLTRGLVLRIAASARLA